MVVVAISGAFGAGRQYVFGLISLNIERNLKEEFFSTIVKKDVAFYDENKTGDLMSRLQSDVESICSALSQNVATFVRSFVTIIFMLVTLFLISPILTGCAFGSIVIIVGGAFWLGFKIRKLHRNRQDEKSGMSIVAQEAFSNIRTVKAFANESVEVEKYTEGNEKTFAIGKQIVVLGAWFTYVV